MRWALLVCVFTASVHAADPVAKAKELAASGDFSGAATVLGKEIASQQRRGDIPAVLELCERLGEIIGSKVGPRDKPDRPNGYRQACHALMKTLDAKRRGAVLSAPMLATELVLQAARAGDDLYLKEAVAVLVKHGKDKKAGLCAKTMSVFALGLLAARERQEGAGEAMAKAYRVMIDHGWIDLAIYAGSELIADRSSPQGGGRVLMELHKILPATKDMYLLTLANEVLRQRLKSLGVPVKDMSFEHPGGTASAAGGEGGKGGEPGGASESILGGAWKRFSRTKPLVTVTRTRAGFDIKHVFEKGYAARRPFHTGVKHHAHGGLTLSFLGRAVRPAMIDLVGRSGQPGESSEPARFQFFHRLAVGETWSMTKPGVVEFRAKR